MRSKRNLDLYGGGTFLSESEVDGFNKFVEGILQSVKKMIQTSVK